MASLARVSLAGKTVFITGASRGIGKAIGLRMAKEGANVVVAAKTVTPHPKLEGTIHSAAAEMEAAGGAGLAVQVDIRDPESISAGVAAAVERFGGIDIVVNNASAISLTGTLETNVKRYDLIHQVDGRGTFLTTQACLPFLLKASNPHILTISPPLNLNPRWFKNHVAYTTAKYNMSMNSLGWAEEFREQRIASNCLWPRTAIATAAMEMLGGKEALSECRKPEIMSDAAYYILSSPSDRVTGNFFIDDDVLLKHQPNVNLDSYAHTPGAKLLPDFFLDEANIDFAQARPNETVIRSSSTAASSSSTGASLAPSVDDFFNKIRQKLESTDSLRQLNCVYRFEIDEGAPSHSSWTIDVEGGTVERTSEGTAHCTISCSHKTLFGLADKTIKPEVAFMKGDLKIKGKMDLALKLAKFF